MLSVRLGYACEMLKSGERKIKDIARLSGLGSQANMRQLFMTRFGCSPSAYRDMVLNDVTTDEPRLDAFEGRGRKPTEAPALTIA